MQLFYNKSLEKGNSTCSFTKEESKHIVKVLRKTIGDTLHITNGKGILFIGKITSCSITHCVVHITSEEFSKKRSYNLHLAVAPTKMKERYEWFLEKATEIGVDTITPIICNNSERKTLKIERLERIIESAAKQALIFFIPKLNPPVTFNDFIKKTKNKNTDTLYIAHCNSGEKKVLHNNLKPKINTTILIGPEGDFSPEEIKMALEHNAIPITLGDNRLRTETAAIVACHTVSLINNYSL